MVATLGDILKTTPISRWVVLEVGGMTPENKGVMIQISCWDAGHSSLSSEVQAKLVSGESSRDERIANLDVYSRV